ncbi:unnamed protein product [Vicia faba]|uniref:Uncharacterized protein n=1 Tax=Vicia faba TaxID=3906 RepID=A0AAV0YH00_VICFA|nr:unnamed protein product [Vicia faba]CAI8584854.1 unnamed protein product [Vicia faba]
MDRPHRLHPVGTTRSPQGRLRHPGLDPPEPQESLFEWDSNSAPFDILRRVALWRAQISWGLRGGDLPCGGCQRFESAYLQLVNFYDIKLYDSIYSTLFFRFGSLV